MRRPKKNCIDFSCHDDNSTLPLKPFDPSKLLPAPNERYYREILKETKRQTSVLCRIKDMLAGFCKLSCGKEVMAPGAAFPRNNITLAPYAYLINQKGRRALTKTRYDKIRSHPDRYDMFINGCSMKCYKKDERGRLIKNTLRAAGFALLKEYIESGKAMFPGATQAVKQYNSAQEAIKNRRRINDESARDYFRDVRRKIDIELGRGKYRAFKCGKEIDISTPSDVYQFSPPPEFKYALICPAAHK